MVGMLARSASTVARCWARSGSGEALVFGVGLLWFADADQFHFFKLMLANHAAHVAATAAGFGAKAHRMRGHPQRQALGIQNVITHDIG